MNAHFTSLSSGNLAQHLSAFLPAVIPAAGAPTPPQPTAPYPAPRLEGQPRLAAPLAWSGTKQPVPPSSEAWFPPPATPPRQPSVATGAEDDFVLRLYLRDTRRAPRLTADEETSAAWLASFDDASGREQLVLGHLRLVVRIAYDYRGMGLTLGDLINEGNLGLMRATELFDPVRGVRFASYADASIRQRMRRALSYQAWPVRLPADLNWRQGQVQAIEEQLTGRLHREPDDAEVASACRLTLPAVRRLRSGAEPTFVSLDNPMPGEDEPGRVLAEVLPDEHSPAPDERLARRSDCEFAARLLATLRPAEQRVLRLRFGFGDGCERTLEEVGQELGYVRQGIHRIESVALAKLRQRVRRPEWC